MKINYFYYKIPFLPTILLFSISLIGQEIKQDNSLIVKDSINYWIKEAKNSNNTLHKRFLFLNKSHRGLKNFPENKFKSKTLSKIAYRYYKLKDTITFKKLNIKTLELANKIKDTFTIADVHWSYGDFYKGKEMYTKSYPHYILALENFEKLNLEYETGRMLYSMAYIKGRYKDYTSSEILTFKAIKKFKKIKNYKWLYTAYNHLGLLQQDIKEYNKSIKYFNKALEYYQKLEKKNIYYSINNNIGLSLIEKNEFKKALKKFNLELNKKLTRRQYAIIINNRANCKLLIKDTLEVKKDLYKSLFIRDSLKNQSGIVSSKIHISNYYKYIKDTINALKYSKEANLLAKELKNSRDYLTTLQQLSNLDPKNSKKYLDRYIQFNDSLVLAERRTQNKFTRIEFETDEYIEDNKRLNQQNIWILIASLGSISILGLLYFIRIQRGKNEKLRFEAEQQKANEEVYVLTLQQQAKLEEERVNERNRISAELHDGILGKLFGTRMGLGFLGMEVGNESQEKHQEYVNQLQEIEKEIRDVSHKLSENFNDSNINFSSILNQLVKDKSTVGNFKYKINLDKAINWKAFNEVTKANIYRIIQEALQNIIKHAKAKNVSLDISKEKSNIHIKLNDNGVGFNTKTSKKGIGIKNITHRVKKLNGTLNLNSNNGEGTLISIKIPVENNGK